MTPVKVAARRTFQALRVRNYRLYFTGQVISVSGTWMQTVAQGWLVLRLTGSPLDLGFVTALQFLPMLLFGTWGGLIVDRVSKRRLLFVTQASAGLLALTLGLLDVSGAVTLWQVYLLATLLGVVNMFDTPARSSFVQEMVGQDLLPNAVSLNTVVMNSARIVGPGLAGVLIATLGTSVCFLVNAGSYVGVIVALALMDASRLRSHPPVQRAKGQLREGFRYVWHRAELRAPLMAMAIVGIFAFNFQVTLPLVARYTFHAGADAYGALFVAMGAGAVVGGLWAAHRSAPSVAKVARLGLLFGILLLGVSVAPTMVWAMILLVPMGGASIAFIATANATLQLSSSRAFRGRVMALYAVAFLGSTPIGAPIMGAVSSAASPRVALVTGGVATLAACMPLAMKFRSAGRSRLVPSWHDEETAAAEERQVA